MKKHLSLLKVLPLVLSLTISSLVFGQATLAANASAPGVPRLVMFGGLLKDASGNTLTNTVGVIFAIYSEQTGGEIGVDSRYEGTHNELPSEEDL